VDLVLRLCHLEMGGEEKGVAVSHEKSKKGDGLGVCGFVANSEASNVSEEARARI
jgi:hypothetical protein